MKLSTPLLLLCSLITLAACSSHQQTATQPVVKTTPAQHFNINSMKPEFLYLAAQDAVKDGQYTLAIQLLSALVQQDQAAITPRIQLLELLLESGQHQPTQQHIDVLLKRTDLSSKQIKHLKLTNIRLLASQNDINTALHLLDTFIDKYPADPAAHNIQAKILANQQRYDEAILALDKALAFSDLADFHLLKAQLFIKSNNHPDAIKSLLRLQQLEPNNDTAVLMLAALALKDNNTAQSERFLRNFLLQYPTALRISQALGQLLINDKRPVEAILVYRDATSLSGNNPMILKPLGMLYFQRQNYSEAESTFRQLVATNPNDSNRFYLAASLEALHRITEARNIYLNISPRSPLSTDAQLRLAAMEVMSDQIHSAEKRLKNILSNNPRHLDSLLLLSTIRLNQGKFQPLLNETKNILSMPKPPAQLLFNRAVAAENLKQYDHVEVMLNRVILAIPNHTEALNFLGYTYAIQGIKLGKAEALLHRALLLKPDNGYYLDSLAWVYYKTGNFDKAIITQTKALEKISDDAIMFDHYGDILWRFGDPLAARQAWKKAIELKAENKFSLKKKISHGLNTSQ